MSVCGRERAYRPVYVLYVGLQVFFVVLFNNMLFNVMLFDSV